MMIVKADHMQFDVRQNALHPKVSLIPRPSLTAFFAAKKAVREGLGTRLPKGILHL